MVVKKRLPLVVGKFEKPHCMKVLKNHLYDNKVSKSTWVTGNILNVAALLGREYGLQKQKCFVAL
jgi:hypothetical protein